MSKTRSLNLWRGDRPEPKDFALHRDPLHQTDQGCDAQSNLIDQLTQTINDWLEKKSGPSVDDRVNELRSEWLSKGGSLDIFNSSLKKAFTKSGYYKRMLKV